MTGGSILSSANYLNIEGMFGITKIDEAVKGKYNYHTHDFVEIRYVYSGTGYHIINDKKYKVYKGDLFIINYDIYHAFFKETATDNLITFNIMFKPGFIDENLLDLEDFSVLPKSYLFKNLWADDALWADEILKEDLRLSFDEQKEFDIIVNNIYNESLTKNNGYVSMIRIYLLLMISKIFRWLAGKDMQEERDQDGRKQMMINNVINYLRENYNREFNLGEISRRSFFSKNYFCRIFKQYTGMTVFEYMHSVRIKEACRLIGSTGDSMAEIACIVGFNDYKNFSSSFKKETGMKPSEYRRHLAAKHTNRI